MAYCGAETVLLNGKCRNRDCHVCYPLGSDPMTHCPQCNGSGLCAKWGECLACAGRGTVRRSLARLILRVRDEAALRPRVGGDRAIGR
jgi:hypothetical protein